MAIQSMETFSLLEPMALSVYSGCIILYASVCTAAAALARFAFTPARIKAPSAASCTALISFKVPGINVSATHLPAILFILLLNGLLHEMGHGFAATLYGIPVLKWGVFIFTIYPGAFVELDMHQLQKASRSTVFKVYSAGVVNNAFLSFLFWILSALTVNVEQLCSREALYPVIKANLHQGK
jgi:S2P endopeptidase